MASPRIGRADRLAALAQQLEALPPGWPAVTRLALTPAPGSHPGPSRKALAAAAAQLAELLEPLPNALHELGLRIGRHCGHQRDAELARAVDLVRGRTFDLFLAIRALREASGARARCVAGVLALLLLAGCTMTSAGPYPGRARDGFGTTYINRATGETWWCGENLDIVDLPIPGTRNSARGYPLCLKLLEWAGYERLP